MEMVYHFTQASRDQRTSADMGGQSGVIALPEKRAFAITARVNHAGALDCAGVLQGQR
jgi:hypothetical protein